MNALKGVTLTFTFASSAEAVKFIELLNKKLGKGCFLGEIKGNKVKVFIPLGKDHRRLVQEVKHLYAEVHSSSAYRPRSFEVTTVFSASNLKVAIPVQALLEALRVEGYKAELRGSRIVTDASFQHLTELAERLSEAYSEAVRLKLTSPLRRIAAVAAVCSSSSVDQALKLLMDQGLVTRSKDGYLLAMTPDAVVEKLKDVLGKRRTGASEHLAS
mgnify:CR=1 FL=1